MSTSKSNKEISHLRKELLVLNPTAASDQDTGQQVTSIPTLQWGGVADQLELDGTTPQGA